MNIYRLFLGAALGAVSSAAFASGTTTIQASGGSVSSTSSGSNDWTGSTQTAYNATIQYGSTGPVNFKMRQGDPATQTGQQGTPVGTGFSGVNPDGSTFTSGSSTVTTGSNPDAPTYYDATWQSTTTNSSSSTVVDSGTYDPWAVYARDIMASGVAFGGAADLYYQATLFGGRGSLTSFSFTPGQAGMYSFQVGNTDAGGLPLVDIDVFSNDTFAANVHLAPQFEVYLLDPTAAGSPNLTPLQRVFADGSVRVTDSQQLTSLLGDFQLSNGKFDRNLDFGILYRGFTLNTNDPQKTVFSWTTDTRAEPVPEPASMAVLGFGVLAGLRRRRK